MAIVYIIKFPNNKVYVGITSRTLSYRRYEHDARKREGNSRLLYNALRKYDSLETWDILEQDITYKEAKLKEIEYIEKYKSNNKEFGYNLTAGGDGSVGYKFSNEQKENLSKSHKNPHAISVALRNLKNIKSSKGIEKPNTKKVKVTNLLNGKVTIYRSIMDLQKIGFGRSSVSACCLGKRKSHKKHKFEYLIDS